MDRVHVVKDALVDGFRLSVHEHMAVKLFGLMDAPEGCNLPDKSCAFSWRDEAGGLDGVNHRHCFSASSTDNQTSNQLVILVDKGARKVV